MLPPIVITSWERGESMHAYHVIASVLAKEPDQTGPLFVPLLTFRFLSLEQDEEGFFSLTSATRIYMLRSWWATNRSHLIKAWMAFSAKPKLTWAEWLDVTTDIEAAGGSIIEHLSL
jgi:hypothetical protein